MMTEEREEAPKVPGFFEKLRRRRDLFARGAGMSADDDMARRLEAGLRARKASPLESEADSSAPQERDPGERTDPRD